MIAKKKFFIQKVSSTYVLTSFGGSIGSVIPTECAITDSFLIEAGRRRNGSYVVK